MRIALRFALVIVVSTAADQTRADGLLYQLPEDGSWVRFERKRTLDRNGKKHTSKDYLKMSSVGRITVKNDQCRWIEFRLSDVDGNIKYIDKLLIPEKHLRMGTNPTNHVLKVWGKRRDDEPVQIDPRNSNYIGGIPQWLAGSLKDVKQLKREIVAVKKMGNVECDGLTGNLKIKSIRSESHNSFHIRLHKEAPFGVVSCRIESRLERDGEVLVRGTDTYELVDFGTDSKTELPNQN